MEPKGLDNVFYKQGIPNGIEIDGKQNAPEEHPVYRKPHK